MTDDDWTKMEPEKIAVSREAWEKLQHALANPKPPTEKLKELLRSTRQRFW